MLQKQAYESLKNEFDETRDELNKIKQNLAQTQEQAGDSLSITLCCYVACVSCRACRVVSCRVVSCRVVSCRVVSCRAVPCRVVSCRVSCAP